MSHCLQQEPQILGGLQDVWVSLVIRHLRCMQDIPAATESAGQAAAAVDGVFHVLAAGEEAEQEEQHEGEDLQPQAQLSDRKDVGRRPHQNDLLSQ